MVATGQEHLFRFGGEDWESIPEATLAGEGGAARTNSDWNWTIFDLNVI